jgi:hypothetical protein
MFESQEQHAVRQYLKARKAIKELQDLIEAETFFEFCCIPDNGSPLDIAVWQQLDKRREVAREDLFTFSGWTWDDIIALHEKNPL